MFDLDIATLIARAIVLLVAFTIHELAHAVSADWLGDPTPRRMGRITLNPIAHLDPIGTIALLVAGFGWAKPVMVNPLNMRGNPRTSMAIVAAAGPLSNLVMAALFALPMRFGLVGLEGFFGSSGSILPSLSMLLGEFVWINLILMFFNLIPIPPLDGYKILMGILPPEMGYRLRPLEQYGFIILLLVVFLVPSVLGVIVGQPSQAVMFFLLGL
ncbi:MAG: site-2 protease family protein [Anaerolineales bacterium]|nr:site-2 protease family protein [Anaerolineales bacterium]